ncbi:MAG: alpha/beta hydrolase [Pseudomonadota bacterium]|jgi:arylformamidase
MRRLPALLIALGVLAATAPADAQRLRDRIAERAAARAEAKLAKTPTPEGLLRDLNVSYGPDKAQVFDVYRPKAAQGAPIVVMAHGGGWRIGDKAMGKVIDNKVPWLAGQGFIFVSVNYRMLPDADVATQARDVARAIAAVQAKASAWGGDPSKVVLMGHSAGAHLVSLLAADPAIAAQEGAKPWLGVVALDSAAMDVPTIMSQRHMKLYDEAFGSDPAVWTALSPLARMKTAPAPLIMVCSSRRADSCPQAQALADKAKSLGGQASVLPQDLSHGEINAKLGEPGAYTDAVGRFLASVIR